MAEIQTVTEELLMSQQMAFTLFASQMTAAEAYEEVNKFQEKIVDFVEKYMTGRRAVDGKKVWIQFIFRVIPNTLNLQHQAGWPFRGANRHHSRY